VGDLTVVSPRNLSHPFAKVGGVVKGEDCTRTILLIPTGVLNPSIEGAAADALKKEPQADALMDATITFEQIFAIIFGETCFRVTGQPIDTRASR
jgi:hypothetical protein